MMGKKAGIFRLVCLAVLLIYIASAHSAFAFRLEKDVPYSEVPASPLPIEAHIFTSATSLTPLISQTFPVGKLTLARYATFSGEGAYRVIMDFTETAPLTSAMELWWEFTMNGTMIGKREQVPSSALALFASEAMIAGDADTVDGQHAADFSQSGHTHPAGDISGGILPVNEGGTGADHAAGALTNLGAASSGANSDITSLSGLTTPISSSSGGTGVDTSAEAAGSLLYTSTPGTWTTLPQGTPGQVLKITGGGFPGWGTDNTGGGAGVTEISQGTGISFNPSTITSTGSVSIDTAVVPQLSTSNFFLGTQTVQSAAAGSQSLVLRGASGQTANLQEWQDSSGSQVAAVGASGSVIAGSFSGGGTGLTSLNASSLSSGTVPTGRLAGTYGIDITGNAAGITGILPLSSGGTGSNLSATGGSGQFLKQTATGGAVSVSTIGALELPSHNHSATDMSSGTLPVTRGGTGASNASAARTNLGAAAAIHAHDFIEVTGTLQSSQLSGTYSGPVTLSNATITSASISGGTIAGNGSGLTSLTPANISAGTAGIDITGNAATATIAANADTVDGQHASAFTPASATRSIHFGWSLNAEIGNGTTEYLRPSGYNAMSNSGEGGGLIVVPASCTAGNFIIKLASAPGLGVTRTFTLRSNSVDTAITCSIIGSSTTCSSTAIASLAAGDDIALQHSVSGGDANTSALRWGWECR